MKAERYARTQLRYLAAWAGFIALGLIFIVGLNLLVDPLWYYSGTQIGTRNYRLNDRTSKINLIRQDLRAYDCLVFGSSVTTLLNASKIRGYKCFNAALAAATGEELLVYARYLRKLGVDPRLVIVDLGPEDLKSRRPSALEMPEFIRNGDSPTPALAAYLSFDVFWFSVRSSLGLMDRDTWYTPEFVIRQVPREQPLTPTGALDAAVEFEDFAPGVLAIYAELLDIWPQARRIGYVSFVNAWVVADWQKRGILDAYMETVYAASAMFDEFYDFSAPSHVTLDLTQTTDGLHFSVGVNDWIAARINGDQSSLGLAIHGSSYREFRQQYLQRVEGLPADVIRCVNSRLPSSERSRLHTPTAAGSTSAVPAHSHPRA